MSGPGVPDALRHGDHVCAVWESAAQRRGLTADFVRDGLEAGDRVACFCHGRTPAHVLDELRAEGFPVDRACAESRLGVFELEDFYLAELPFDPGRTIAMLDRAVDDALAAGFAGLRVTGDVDWGAGSVPGNERLEEYEERVTELFATRPAAALCQYGHGRLPGARLDGLVGIHPRALAAPRTSPDGVLHACRPVPDSAGATWVRLGGEADIESAGLLREALAEAAARGPGDVHLDLRGLRFADVAGVGALRDAAATLGPDRRVVLHHAPPALCRLLELLPHSGVEVAA